MKRLLIAIFLAIPSSCLAQYCAADSAPVPASGVCTCNEQVVSTISCKGNVPGVDCALDESMPACGTDDSGTCYVYRAAACSHPSVVRAGTPIAQMGNFDLSPWRSLLPTKQGTATACSTPQEFEGWLKSYLTAKRNRAQVVKFHETLEPKDKDATRAAL
jgi:hypothetical protein